MNRLGSFASSLLSCTAIALVITAPAQAATFQVASRSDLQAAIQTANSNGEPNVIQLTSNILLDDALPVIGNDASDSLTIDLNGYAVSGGNTQRIFFANAGSIRIVNGDLIDSVAKGGDGGVSDGLDSGAGGGGMGAGGALYVRAGATVEIENVSFANNSAVGGNGGSTNPGGLDGGGGGGGGLGGDGGYGGGARNGTVQGGGGGGGGALSSQNGADGNGTVGGNGGGLNGGAGGSSSSGTGADGGDLSGGGGSGFGSSPGGGSGGYGGGGGGIYDLSGRGGNGGFGGGGGGAASNNSAGAGGFGGGSGGAQDGSGALSQPGFGGGSGGTNRFGGGGAGFGGAVFVQGGGTLTIAGTASQSGGSSVAGTGSQSGQAAGSAMFLAGSGTLTFAPGAGQTQTITNVITDQVGFVQSSGYVPPAGTYTGTERWGIAKTGAGTLTLAGANLYAGDTTISQGILSTGSVSGSEYDGLGLAGNTIVLNGGTLQFTSTANQSLYNLSVTSGATASITATNGNTAFINQTPDSSLSLGANSTLVIGSPTDTGTIVLQAYPVVGSIPSSAAIVVAGGTLRNDADAYLDDYFSVISRTQINAGAAVELRDKATTIRNLQSTGASASLVIGTASTTALTVQSGSFDGVISGAGSLSKTTNDTLVLGGVNTYAGPTIVAAGRLAVNGSTATSATTVQNGATLGGNGTVGQTTIQSGATLGAGNSIGILNVAGSLTLDGGSLLDVEIADGGNTPGIHNDLVAVAGTATIAPTASVAVHPTNGTDTGSTFLPDTQYTILTTTGGRTGTFGSVADQFAFLDASLGYDANNVYLTLTRNDQQFIAAGETPNQIAAAGALADFPAGETTTAVLNLTQAQAPAAFEQASGDANATAQYVIGQTFDLFSEALSGKGGGGKGEVMSYVDAGPDQVGSVGSAEATETLLAPNAVWVAPLAGRGTIESDGNGAAADWTAGGLAFGYERQVVIAGGDATFGVGAGYLRSNVDIDARNATANSEGGNIGAYGEWTNGPALLSGNVTYGFSNVDGSRNIVIGALDRTAEADYWLHNVGVELEASYGFELTDELSVGPVAGIDLDWFGHDGFTETGAGDLNATVDGTSVWTATTQLGAAMAYSIDGEAGDFTVKGRALWLHQWGDTSADPTITLAGGGGPFEVSSAEVGRDRLELGAGLDWAPTDDTKLSLDYTGRFFGGQTEHVVAAGLAVKF